MWAEGGRRPPTAFKVILGRQRHLHRIVRAMRGLGLKNIQMIRSAAAAKCSLTANQLQQNSPQPGRYNRYVCLFGQLCYRPHVLVQEVCTLHFVFCCECLVFCWFLLLEKKQGTGQARSIITHGLSLLFSHSNSLTVMSFCNCLQASNPQGRPQTTSLDLLIWHRLPWQPGTIAAAR
jgi:hypothetical protein